MARKENHEREPEKHEPQAGRPIQRRRSLIRVCAIGLLIGLIVALAGLVAACAENEDTDTTTTAAAAPTQTLKIGYLAWLSGIQGVQFYDSVKGYVAMVNDNGGIAIGEDRYAIELVEAETNENQSTAVAAANKLIFEDGVKFIVADEYVEAFSTDSEANAVLISGKSLTPNLLTPDTKYLFNTGFSNSESAVAIRWWTENYPDKNKIMLLLPDMGLGHFVSDLMASVCTLYGMEVTQEFYALGVPDLSAVGTKVKNANPDVVTMFEMSPLRAIREAGWTGQFFSVGTNSLEALLATASIEDLEGFIGTAFPTEFDPPLTQMATDFKAAYTKLFGEWNNPTVSDTAMFSALVAAIEQAQSVDVDAVAEVLAGGMTWESPCGPMMMVPRPDVGNNKTVDSVNTMYMKQIVNGEVVLLDTIDVDTSAAYFADYLAQAAPYEPPEPAADGDSAAKDIGVYFTDQGDGVVRVTEVPTPGMELPVHTGTDQFAATIEAFDAEGNSLGNLELPEADGGVLDYSAVDGIAKIVVTNFTGAVFEYMIP